MEQIKKKKKKKNRAKNFSRQYGWIAKQIPKLKFKCFKAVTKMLPSEKRTDRWTSSSIQRLELLCSPTKQEMKM